MRTITKTIDVYNYNELSCVAQERARLWWANGDYMSIMSEEATNNVCSWMQNDLELDEMPDIEWDTCSAGFIRDFKITGAGELSLEHIKEYKNTLQEQIDYYMSDEFIEEEMITIELEFTKYGKYYRD